MEKMLDNIPERDSGQLSTVASSLSMGSETPTPVHQLPANRITSNQGSVNNTAESSPMVTPRTSVPITNRSSEILPFDSLPSVDRQVNTWMATDSHGRKQAQSFWDSSPVPVFSVSQRSNTSGIVPNDKQPERSTSSIDLGINLGAVTILDDRNQSRRNLAEMWSIPRHDSSLQSGKSQDDTSVSRSDKNISVPDDVKSTDVSNEPIQKRSNADTTHLQRKISNPRCPPSSLSQEEALLRRPQSSSPKQQQQQQTNSVTERNKKQFSQSLSKPNQDYRGSLEGLNNIEQQSLGRSRLECRSAVPFSVGALDRSSSDPHSSTGQKHGNRPVTASHSRSRYQYTSLSQRMSSDKVSK